jgi:hypothetical protein
MSSSTLCCTVFLSNVFDLTVSVCKFAFSKPIAVIVRPLGYLHVSDVQGVQASLLPDKCFTIPALPAGCLDVPDGEGVQACLLPVQPLPQHQHSDILFVPLYVKYARVVAVWTDRVKINIVEQKLDDNFNITDESLILGNKNLFIIL